jgi:hypothetical protein
VFSHQPSPPACDRDEERCAYTLIDLFGNASNLPYLVAHGGMDELVPSSGPELWMDDYRQRGLPHRYAFYPHRRHEARFPGTSGTFVKEWLLDLPARERSPSHVTYTVLRDLQQPAHGITYDGAYWVDGLRLAPGADEGSIAADRSFTPPRRVAFGPRLGVDDTGPYRLTGIETSAADSGPSRSLDVTLSGLDRASVDTVRMRWDPDETNSVFVDTDTALELTLVGEFADGLVVEGAEFRRDGSDVVLILAAGATGVEIRPA